MLRAGPDDHAPRRVNLGILGSSSAVAHASCLCAFKRTHSFPLLFFFLKRIHLSVTEILNQTCPDNKRTAFRASLIASRRLCFSATAFILPISACLLSPCIAFSHSGKTMAVIQVTSFAFLDHK